MEWVQNSPDLEHSLGLYILIYHVESVSDLGMGDDRDLVVGVYVLGWLTGKDSPGVSAKFPLIMLKREQEHMYVWRGGWRAVLNYPLTTFLIIYQYLTQKFLFNVAMGISFWHTLTYPQVLFHSNWVNKPQNNTD